MRIANNPMFRPPGEASSLILQVDEGCPWNRCTFCGMYKGKSHHAHSLEAIEDLIHREAERQPGARRIFLADGDVMRRPFDELRAILEMLNARFPRLTRVSLYANGRSIAAKTVSELAALRALKLHTLYMGLESGDEEILKRCCKGETADGMVTAGQMAQQAGLRLSVMILLGLGGVEHRSSHIVHTADALNRMQPRLLSALRVIPVAGTPLHEAVTNGSFRLSSEAEIVRELRALIAGLELTGTVFRANHSSNIVPVEARFPYDKQRVLAELDALLATGMLDDDSPGHLPAWL
jgi:radical SAM superfamily enzyme YgiQ (UPF0313 family)